MRTLEDLPWATWRLTLKLSVRKFFCSNPVCARRIFTERLPAVVEPWARRTRRLVERLIQMTLALAGRAAARLGHHLGLHASRNTLLHLLSRLALPRVDCAPRTLGVDDFAWRKRHSYGTILVDLEHSRPIALLADREAASLSAWLKAHPGAEVISRDRAGAYKSGATQGAPQAVQVADRFHLLQNLAEVLTEVFASQTTALRAVDAELKAQQTREAKALLAVHAPTMASLLMTSREAPPPDQQRLARHEHIWQLHRLGRSTSVIAAQVGVSPKTVQRYLRTPELPEGRLRSDRGKSRNGLEAHKAYLWERWQAGCHQARQLYRELRERGYQGCYMSVSRLVRQLRLHQGIVFHQLPSTRLSRQARVLARPVPTPRWVAWLLLRHPQRRNGEQNRWLECLALHPQFSAAVELGLGFVQLVRDQQPEGLVPWIHLALHSGLKPLERFAAGLIEDEEAVRAGLSLAVSNGVVEGHINRLKMLKRQMYGRAGLELLARRVLLAS